jgi:outer membrane protein assembly factor BamB
VLLAVLLVSSGFSADWPAFRGGPDHAGVTDETLQTPLALAWQYQANHPPQPAFRGGLAPSSRRQRVEPITYDYAFEPVVAEGRLFFGSSSEEAVFCLDCATGAAVWSFHAQGPVRFAPRVAGNRLYFGCDDGWVYCLDAARGSLIWRLQAAPSDRRCVAGGRVISAWPVRTSVALADGVLYFGAGLFPTMGTYLCAAGADSGRLLWRRPIPYSPHGEILIEGDTLVVATGRTAPAEFRRSDGKPRAEAPSPRRALGGSFVAKANEMLVWGPDESGVMFLRVSREPIADFRPQDRGTTVAGRVTGLRAHSVMARDRLYLVRQEQILAVDGQTFQSAALENPEIQWRRWEKTTSPRYGSRPFGLGRAGLLVSEDRLLIDEVERAKAWSAPNADHLTTAILAGDSLILGGKGTVVVLDAESGDRRGACEVEGEARGLAVADGSLLVSTDRGRIYCFRHAVPGSPRVNKPRVEDALPADPTVASAVETVLRHADTRRGICVVLGVGDGRLAAEIARQSEFFVVAIDPDAACVDAARAQLARAGVYGERVVVHHVPEEEPAYPAWFANLIVSEEIAARPSRNRVGRDAIPPGTDRRPALPTCASRTQTSESATPASGRLPYRPSAVLRLLQPYGGTIALRSEQGATARADWRSEELSAWESASDDRGGPWQVAHRGPLRGAGEWTQMYANPANTVSSGDRLVGADFVLQWFGPPGAEDVVERHAVAMPPLFKEGKLFVAGLTNTIRCIDAYNGTLRWKTTVPESTRMMLSHSAGFMAAGDGVLFVAAEADCWMLDADTGALLHRFPGVRAGRDWGYVGAIGDCLLGSDQKTPADEYSYGKRKGGYRFLTSAKDLHSRPTVSETLFAYDYGTRDRVWTYEGPSAILNATITVGADRVYFAESRNPDVLADETGTAWLPSFFARDARLVALDLADGRPLWSQPLGPLSDAPDDEHEHIMFLSYADGLLLSTRTGHVDRKLSYRLEARDAATGETAWRQTLPSRHRVYAPLTYGKNGQQSHPSIVGGKVFLLSHITDALITLDLRTGHVERHPALYDFWIHSKTCAVPTASASGLYFRRDSCYLFDLPSRRAIDLTAVTRPGCWMSIIPAGGLVLMPEASSGCTCGFALQTSVVLAPDPSGTRGR